MINVNFIQPLKENKQTNKAPDKVGRGYGYCGLEKDHQCPWGWTAYWREKNYIYIYDVLIKRFTHIAEHMYQVNNSHLE